jgi:hypothetical protein
VIYAAASVTLAATGSAAAEDHVSSNDDNNARRRQSGVVVDDFSVDIHASELNPVDGHPPVSPASSGGYPKDSNGNEYTCTEQEITNESQQNAHWWVYPEALQDPANRKPSDGRMVQRLCRYVDPGLGSVPTDDPAVPPQGYVWVPSIDETPNPEQVFLNEAIGRLESVEPVITIWPAGIFVVGIPTRFRVENFTTQEANTGTPAVQVWARAEPYKAVWTLGDVEVTCDFAGKPLERDDDDAPDACKHTFHQSTRGETMTGRVEVHYHVVWGSTLTPGEQPLPDIRSQPHTFEYQVRGYQAVIQ